MQSHPTPSAHVCTPPAAGAFTHTPRPPQTPATPEHWWQRRYPGTSGSNYVRCKEPESRHLGAEVEVWRDAGCDTAEVRTSLGLHTCASITARMTPAEMRDLAERLIDAAHDIEANPAAALAAAGQTHKAAA